MITAEQIKGVNERIKKIEVKGKAYACVPARVQAFREICPEGSIETDVISMADGIVTMKTTVKDETGRVLATGMAQEKEASSYINKTSYIENCETSAVGRALGMLGLGSDEQMASAEELANAINNQGGNRPAYERPVEGKTMYCANCGRPIEDGKRNGGSVWPAADIAAYTERKYGRCLCVNCGKAAQKAMDDYANREDGEA